VGVGRSVFQQVKARKKLSVPQGKFQFAVVALNGALGGVGAAVEFQVKFSLPLRPIGAFGEYAFEGIGDFFPACFWNAFQVGEAAGSFQVSPGSSAAAVPLADGLNRSGLQLFVLYVVPGLGKLGGINPSVVTGCPGVDVVGLYACSVDPLPNKRVVGEAGCIVPVNLARYKVFDSALRKYLRQGRGITENIGQPEVVPLVAQHFLSRFFTHKELTHQGFTACNITVSLNPHGAIWFPVSLAIGFLYGLENFRVLTFDNFKLGALGLDENKLRVFLRELRHVYIRTGDLPFSFADVP